MMNKKDSGRWASAKSLCLVPAVGAAICLAACVGNGENKSAESDVEAKDTTTVDNSKQDTTAPTLVITADTAMNKSEVMPEFPGGTESMMKFLVENIKYPKEAMDKGIAGRVFVEFVVEQDGSLSDVKVLRSVDPILDNEAVRIVKTMPKWKPGTEGGKTVRVKYVLPIVFRLQ